MINRIYIYGSGPESLDHDQKVLQSFVSGYELQGGDWQGENAIGSLSITEAAGSGFQIYIKSCAGMAGQINEAQLNYGSIQTIMPAGANSPGEIFDSNGGQNLPSIIVTGGGDDNNEDADDIEFFSNDPITPETIPDELDLSSFANGFIAGQIAYIANQRDCSIWEARYCARRTGSESGVWNEINGYGKIDVNAAINYSGEIPVDPYNMQITNTGAELLGVIY